MENIMLLIGMITGLIMITINFTIPFNQRERKELEKKLKSAQGIRKKFLAIIYIVDNHRGFFLTINSLNMFFLLSGLVVITFVIQSISVENEKLLSIIAGFWKNIESTSLLMRIILSFSTGYLLSLFLIAILMSILGSIWILIETIKKVKNFTKDIIVEYKKLMD